ncbi:hypothetical protein [Sciscionella sediminilitoris]|uniref:hypothetical protein n=1 Tax=Sciscionella sediminilitoris TaxID=1445613 RepID=UPI001E554E40|nr:hypothetical protein [Sciscionella sp. SE31]
MDDTNRAQTGHPGVAIFPVATAEAERLDVDAAGSWMRSLSGMRCAAGSARH